MGGRPSGARARLAGAGARSDGAQALAHAGGLRACGALKVLLPRSTASGACRSAPTTTRGRHRRAPVHGARHVGLTAGAAGRAFACLATTSARATRRLTLPRHIGYEMRSVKLLLKLCERWRVPRDLQGTRRGGRARARPCAPLRRPVGTGDAAPARALRRDPAPGALRRVPAGLRMRCARAAEFRGRPTRRQRGSRRRCRPCSRWRRRRSPRASRRRSGCTAATRHGSVPRSRRRSSMRAARPSGALNPAQQAGRATA